MAAAVRIVIDKITLYVASSIPVVNCKTKLAQVMLPVAKQKYTIILFPYYWLLFCLFIFLFLFLFLFWNWKEIWKILEPSKLQIQISGSLLYWANFEFRVIPLFYNVKSRALSIKKIFLIYFKIILNNFNCHWNRLIKIVTTTVTAVQWPSYLLEVPKNVLVNRP